VPPIDLSPFIGRWTMHAEWPSGDTMDPGELEFSWLGNTQEWLVQRWNYEPPFPSGVALMGWDEGRGTLLQHYFDDRGVARVYTMSFDGRVWEMSRTSGDFSEFEFSEDGTTNEGECTIQHPGQDWETDFHVVYTRVG
jgi:hypothetical protein